MRREWIIISVMLATVLAAGVDVAVAQRMATTTTVVRPDLAEFQAAAIDWLRNTVTSSQFVFGAAIGVVLAEGGRFLWRWSMRTLGFCNALVGLVLHHRLIAAGVAGLIGYAAVYAGMV